MRRGIVERTLRAGRAAVQGAADLAIGSTAFARAVAVNVVAAYAGASGDAHVDGTSAAVAARPDLEDKIRGAALDSLIEDLAEIGEKYVAGQFYNADLVRAKAAHRRADAQVTRLSRARDLLLVVVEAFVPPNYPDEGVHASMRWARDVSGPAWVACKVCRHFLLDHDHSGGCRAVRCACELAGFYPVPESPPAT